ncbi:phosphate ABC transporter permease subunit PstC [Salinarimonas rosea]|uniref:phosphate ABC transporter permease subunit PstC n=1 Tax=Salinarimonas rosea TaxID=552063 RepID=UPI000401B9EA|nr:phosphate ABC transporter permease subunit PstC [Salinarimonas rosea]
MNTVWLAIIVLVAMGFAYRFGTQASRRAAVASASKLHSLPGHYGMLVALWLGIPALAVILLFALFGDAVVRSLVMGALPADVLALPQAELLTVMQRIQALASGFGVLGEPAAYEVSAAERLRTLQTTRDLALVAGVAAAAAAGLVFALRRISPSLRARNEVETVVRTLLIACSTVAILTTVGIVLSLVGETLRFFSYVSPIDFFFGTVWNPRFVTVGAGSADGYGLLPLLWGTVLIAAIAMLVSLPVGLMIAIYMAEYAPARLRAVAKPLIEILAGIPTIVYGFFALTIAGPALSNAGALVGLDIRATSALTAGVVMGIMIIPFISSLSDDIITQVPRTMRDGSLGLGATRSETIKRVVLPAALPGIVGAFLLAVSRAIGETMIVVLAAGNAPVLQPNPFESVSTVTVTIVKQLTGDIDFASPQSLVAFALGLTLFVLTLGLNVLALYIVRRFREQYE